MECLFIADWDGKSTDIILPAEEQRHCKALRLRDNEAIMITNGKGQKCIAEYLRNSTILRLQKNLDAEPEPLISLAMGVLESRDRWEFAIEKAVEIGCRAIYPLTTSFTQKQSYNTERTLAKIVAAVKQSRRANIPALLPMQTVQQAGNAVLALGDKLFIASEHGQEIPERTTVPATIFIGPEGGFSAQEEQMLLQMGAKAVSLGKIRLRAETAAIVGLARFSA